MGDLKLASLVFVSIGKTGRQQQHSQNDEFVQHGSFSRTIQNAGQLREGITPEGMRGG
jgi:hypothetical protein